MRLIKKYDAFVPVEELDKVVNNETSSSLREAILKLITEAFKLGREAERLEAIDGLTDKEGGVVKIVQFK